MGHQKSPIGIANAEKPPAIRLGIMFFICLMVWMTMGAGCAGTNYTAGKIYEASDEYEKAEAAYITAQAVKRKADQEVAAAEKARDELEAKIKKTEEEWGVALEKQRVAKEALEQDKENESLLKQYNEATAEAADKKNSWIAAKAGWEPALKRVKIAKEKQAEATKKAAKAADELKEKARAEVEIATATKDAIMRYFDQDVIGRFQGILTAIEAGQVPAALEEKIGKMSPNARQTDSTPAPVPEATPRPEEPPAATSSPAVAPPPPPPTTEPYEKQVLLSYQDDGDLKRLSEYPDGWALKFAPMSEGYRIRLVIDGKQAWSDLIVAPGGYIATKDGLKRAN